MSIIKLKMMGHGCVLSLHLSVCVSITVSAHSSIPCDLFVSSYICQSVGLFFCFSRSSIHLFIRPSTNRSFINFIWSVLFVCLFVCLVSLFVCLVCLFVCLSVLFVCLSVLFVCPFVHLAAWLSIHSSIHSFPRLLIYFFIRPSIP